jgi:uncharacterized membrane protein
VQPLACVRTKKILWVLYYYPITKCLVQKTCVLAFSYWWLTIKFLCSVLGVYVGKFVKKKIVLHEISLVMGHEMIFIMQGGAHEGYFKCLVMGKN